MTTATVDLDVNRHVDFGHALETYMIYPWVRDGDTLVRPLRTGEGDATITTARIRQHAPTLLRAELTGNDLGPETIEQVRATLARTLQLDYPYDRIEELTRDDNVLAAAVAHRGYGRGKLYPDVFEALCGAVCSNRAQFKRIYGMMRNLAAAFGEPTGQDAAGEPLYAFPTPARMAEATEEQLRACAVGFRAKGLASIATTLAAAGYTWHEWSARPPAEVIPDLLTIKGIGPYNANLAVNLAFGHGGAAHIDTYVCDVVGRLYLKDPSPKPEQVAAYVEDRWGELAETVLDYLTTDTEIWAAKIGARVGVRSGARG